MEMIDERVLNPSEDGNDWWKGIKLPGHGNDW